MIGVHMYIHKKFSMDESFFPAAFLHESRISRT